MRKELGDHENYKHWNLVKRRYLNAENTIISIWYFNRKRDPYGRLIKHKSSLCANVGMYQWGVNYWETYSPVLNLISVRDMLTLSILTEIHHKAVGFVLAYT